MRLEARGWPEASSWGLFWRMWHVMVANAVRDLKGDEPAVTIEKIRTLFNAELANPADDPTGHF